MAGEMSARSRWRVAAIQVSSVLAVLVLWELVSRLGLGLQELFPSLVAIAAAVVSHLVSGRLVPHLAASGQEVCVGFLVGGGSGLVLGLALATNRFVRRTLEPVILSLAAVPFIVVFPIFVLAFGIGINSKTAMAAASAFLPVAINTIAAAYQVKPVHVRVARMLGAGHLQLVLRVYVPSMIGLILTGLRLGLGVAIVGALLAETKLARAGLGLLAVEYYGRFQLADMYAVLIIVFAIAAGLNYAFSWMTHRFLAPSQRVEATGLHV